MENTIGKRIVQHRKQLGLTQDQLAEQLGVTAQAVSKWENDQSCPDITMLPRLADIFEITTDELLGREAPPPVYVGTIEKEEDAGIGGHVGKLEFEFDSGRKSGLFFAFTVLAVGLMYLLSNLFDLGASFWEILWPTIPLVYGLFGIWPRFSFLRLGCALLGAYFLMINMQLLPFGFGTNLVWPSIIIILGLGLLADAIKKPAKSRFSLKGRPDKRKEQLEMKKDSFDYTASFGESTQYIQLPCLRSGSVSTSFGSYTMNFSGVASFSEDCSMDISCSFGELELLIPRSYAVHPTGNNFFAELTIKGEPDPEPQGSVYLRTNASFGEITIRYI